MTILRSPLIKGAVPVAAICVIAAFRVAATHSIFSPTYDEPVHVASGFQYLTEHRYTIDHSQSDQTYNFKRRLDGTRRLRAALPP